MNLTRALHEAGKRRGVGDGIGRIALLRLAVLALALSVLAAGAVPVGSASATPTLTPSGTVVALGANWSGQTVVPGGLDHVIAVAAGNSNSLALKDDGTVVGWGGNYSGQSNVPVGLDDVIEIAAGGTFSVALKDDGSVVTWGGFFDMTPPAGLDNVVAIAAGGARIFALTDTGTVVAWGWDAYVPAGLADVVAIAAADDHALAVTADGTVVGWGGNSNGELNIPGGLTNVTAVATGWSHSVALKTDGTVIAWGGNWVGQTNVPSGLDHVVAIAAGGQVSLALKDSGEVIGWGWNYYGQLSVPAGLSACAIAVGDYHALVVERAVDITPPLISYTQELIVPATDPAGATVTFPVSAWDDTDGAVPVFCSPESGGLFPINPAGEFMEVACWATDQAGNTATAPFFLHVQGAGEQVTDLIALVDGLPLNGKLGTSLHDKLVTVQRFLAADKPQQAEDNLASFINQVDAQRGKGLTGAQADALKTAALRIMNVIVT